VAPFAARSEAAGNGSQKDGNKCGAFNQRVANRQLLAAQMVRKDSIFDGSKQRREDAKPEQSAVQQRQRSLHITPRGERSYKDFDEFETLGDLRLVVAVGQFTAEGGQEKIGSDEDRARESDQCFGVARAQMEQNDKN